MNFVAMNIIMTNHLPANPFGLHFIKYKNGIKHRTLTLYFEPYLTPIPDDLKDLQLEHIPSFPTIYDQLCDFIENQIIVVHQAEFHIQALQEICDVHKLHYPIIEYCCLSTLLRTLNQPIPTSTDADHCGSLMIKLAKRYGDNSFNTLLRKAKLTIGVLFEQRNRPMRSVRIKPQLISAKSHFNLRNQTIVFTGSLHSMVRSHAAKLVNEIGGICSGSVTSTTNYVVIGDGAINRPTKTSKQIRAEQLIANGHSVNIISEAEFLQLINNQSSRVNES